MQVCMQVCRLQLVHALAVQDGHKAHQGVKVLRLKACHAFETQQNFSALLQATNKGIEFAGAAHANATSGHMQTDSRQLRGMFDTACRSMARSTTNPGARARTSAVSGAPCNMDGTVSSRLPCRNPSTENFSPMLGSVSDTSKCELQHHSQNCLCPCYYSLLHQIVARLQLFLGRLSSAT